MYRFRIVAAAQGQWRAQFLYNSEIIFWSENYSAKAAATNCIDALKQHAADAPTVDVGGTGTGYRFEIVAGRTQGFHVRFVARNGQIMMTTESYTAKASAHNAIEAARKHAADAAVVDETASH